MITHDLINFLANLLDIENRGDGTFYEKPFNFNNQSCITNGYVFFLSYDNLGYQELNEKEKAAVKNILEWDELVASKSIHSDKIFDLFKDAKAIPITATETCKACDGDGVVEYEFYFKKRYDIEEECPVCKGTGEFDTKKPIGTYEYPEQLVKAFNKYYMLDRFYKIMKILQYINYTGYLTVSEPLTKTPKPLKITLPIGQIFVMECKHQGINTVQLL